MTHDRVDVLILTTGLGFGHNQASRAITEALIEQDPQVVSETVDFLTLLPKALARSIVFGHQSLAKHWPSGYGAMYRTTSWMSRFQAWNQIEQRPGLDNLCELLRKSRPNLVIATHPMPVMAISALREAGKYNGATMGVISDYAVHPDWIRPNIDHYCVATADVRKILVEKGLSEDRISDTGIPLRHAFRTPLDYSTIRRKLGWDERPRVLFIVGSQGMKTVQASKAINQLMALPGDVCVVAITADDGALFRDLAKRLESGDKLQVLPFQKNIHEWMAGSDAIVTKAGALTVSEVLSLRRPLIIFRPLPGQETGNARWLIQSGAALYCESPAELSRVTQIVLNYPSISLEMESAASRISRPASAVSTALVCLDLLRRP